MSHYLGSITLQNIDELRHFSKAVLNSDTKTGSIQFSNLQSDHVLISNAVTAELLYKLSDTIIWQQKLIREQDRERGRIPLNEDPTEPPQIDLRDSEKLTRDVLYLIGKRVQGNGYIHDIPVASFVKFVKNIYAECAKE